MSPDGFRAEAFDELAAVEERSFWFRARNRLILWAVGAHAPGARDLLEVGCGSGYVLAGLRAAYPQLRLVGTELFEEGLVAARRRVPDAELVSGDARELAYEAAYDVVGAFDVIEHIDEDELVLTRMARAVRPGGVVLLGVPQHPWLWSAADDYACHKRRYTRAGLTAVVARAGLEVEFVTSWMTVLSAPMAASRLLQRRRPDAYDPKAEHLRAERMAPVLERLLAAELALVRRHVSLPFGGSLFLVARRPAG